MEYKTSVVSLLAGLALIAAPALAMAAETTTEKVERKAGEITDKAKGAAKEAKTGVTDSWLTSKAKIALFADERVKGTQVSVETKNGVVMLRGKVESQGAKTAAGEVARKVDGVKDVRNQLQVMPLAEQKKAVEASDKAITQGVKERLGRDAQLKEAKIDVQADAGVVTLKGEVRDIALSARASEVARRVPGVRSVRNELTDESRG